MYSGVGLLLRWWCWFCGGGVGIRGNLPFLQVVLLFPRHWLRWYVHTYIYISSMYLLPYMV